ncbi:hypothetical protein JCM5350_004365 [Sporobolomyces pararoseus]
MAPAPRGSASGQKFPCSQCDKVFSRKEYMARHFRSKHSKEKPFSCEYCSHGFSRSDLLRRHYKTCQEAKALGVSGPPPGAERLSASTSSTSTRPKRTRTRSTSETSPEVSPDADSPSGRDIDNGNDNDEPMLPTPPELPVASTSKSTLPPNTSFNDLPHPPDRLRYEPPSLQQHDQRAEGPGNMIQQHSHYPPAPSHHHYSMPHPHYNVPYSNPYSHSQYYHPYSQPQQYVPTPGSSRQSFPGNSSYPPPHPSTSAPLDLMSAPPRSDSVAAEPLSHYFRQHPESMQQQIQPAPLPIPQPLSTAPPSSNHQQEQQSQQPQQPSQDFSPASSGSSSAFRPGTASNDTLAPGLSGTGSFSADEVLASEVLRDLMRSPMSVVRPGMSRGDSGDSANGGGQTGGNEGENLGKASDRKGKRKGNAVLLGNHQNEWGLMGGADGFGSSKVNTPIEETPAAIALSSYFNNGGVRGISALDLGFPSEPSLFEDWLLTAQQAPFQDEADRRFQFPENYFNAAYLYPWHVPPLKKLSQYAQKATERLLPSIPVFHAPSVSVKNMALHNAFALTIAGGAYESDGQSFSNEMLVEKRVFLIRGFLEPTKTWEDRFASLQSLLLYQLLGFFHRDEQQRLLAQQFHTSLIYMFKQLDVPKKVRETSLDHPNFHASEEVIEQAWKAWVKVETWKRVTFIVFLTDLEHSIATGAPQFVQLSDMDLDLPSSETAWAAGSAADWHARSAVYNLHPSMSFLSAVRALLAQNPAPFSEHSIVLAELSRLSSFPLLILSRMLSYMEKKCEEALQQVDPFKPLLGGLGMSAHREQENRTMLSRIRNGREILRALPGGLARGGGERWFQDTMPTAFGGAPRRESSSSSTSESSHSNKSKTSSPSVDSLNTPPQDDYHILLAEIEAEEAQKRGDPDAYRPYHGEGGTWPGETFDQAQERMRKLRERNITIVNNLIPDLPVPY